MTTMNLFDMSDTWNSAGTTFTAIKMNVTDTASASGSLLMDLQVGGTSQFSVRKDGRVISNKVGSNAAGDVAIGFDTGGINNLTGQYSGMHGQFAGAAQSRLFFQVANTTCAAVTETIFGLSGTEIRLNASMVNLDADLRIVRDAADTLALRRDTNPQTFRIYNTYSGGGANYERGVFRWISNFLEIGTEAAGTGSARAILLSTGGATRWNIGTVGHLTAGVDNAYDIGASGANRPRDIFVARHVVSAGYVWPGYLRLDDSGGSNGVRLYRAGTGILTLYNTGENDFNRLQFGGTTNAFPSLKRNGTALETKLADDSAYAPHAAQYFEVTDGITAPGAATGRARIYVDTADGDLKVVFADGTIKTIVTDT